jgi:hypothetical protein
MDIGWWIRETGNSFNYITHGLPDITLSTDASKQGWGAALNGLSTGGQWSISERHSHINILEIKAAFLGIKSMCSEVRDKHIRILVDNVTAVAYINDMGGMNSPQCNLIGRQIWHWAAEMKNWISAAHIPGSNNVLADKASRVFHTPTEWSIDQRIFQSIVDILGKPEFDLFASRLNFKLDNYASWKPDPNAKFVNAFNMNWLDIKFYAFPPFSLVKNCLQKITEDCAEGILIAPLWTAQPWFPKLMWMLVECPVLLPLNVLSLPY